MAYKGFRPDNLVVAGIALTVIAIMSWFGLPPVIVVMAMTFLVCAFAWRADNVTEQRDWLVLRIYELRDKIL